MPPRRDESVGRLITRIDRELNARAAQEFKPFGVGAGQFRILAELFHEDGLCQEELTARVGVDKANTARAVDKLEKLGYVRRRRDAEDYRMKRVHLTDEAHSIRSGFLAALERWNALVGDHFSEKEHRVLLLLLKRLDKALEPEPRPARSTPSRLGKTL
jgi:DNA-binding MarR family transcriptional regulator